MLITAAPEGRTERRARLVTMYTGGMTLRQIAASVGVSFQAIHDCLKRAGVTFRRRGGNNGPHSRHAK